MNLPLMPASETIQVDVSHPSKKEVIRKSGFLKKHKKAGPEGLSPSILETGGEVSTSELTQLLGSIRTREQIPKYWCK